MCLLGVLTFDGIIKLRTNFLTTGGRAFAPIAPREKAVKIPPRRSWDTKGNIVPMRIVTTLQTWVAIKTESLFTLRSLSDPSQ